MPSDAHSAVLQIRNVQLADCHVCRFTPSGRFLVCFGALQHEVLLCSYTGLQYGTRGNASADPPQVLHPASLSIAAVHRISSPRTVRTVC